MQNSISERIMEKNHSSSIQLLFFILALLLFYFLLKPLLNIFLASVVLTYVFYPVYKKIRKVSNLNVISILATLLLIVLLFLVPFVFVASQIPAQSTKIYNYAKESIGKDFFSLECADANSFKCKTAVFFSDHFELDKVIGIVFNKITAIATYIVVRIPNIIVGIILALFISFFLFKDGKKLLDNVIRMLPLSRKSSGRLIKNFGDVTYSVVYAHIIVALVQGVLGAAGFYVFGLESAIFWGVIMGIFALLPVIGPAFIWLPASLFMVINGIAINSYLDIGKGIGLLLYGVFIISTSDNLLRIKIIGDKGDIHPLTVLIGIIGGISLFGMIGVFVGPIALSLLITYFRDFSVKYK